MIRIGDKEVDDILLDKYIELIKQMVHGDSNYELPKGELLRSLDRQRDKIHFEILKSVQERQFSSWDWELQKYVTMRQRKEGW